jgi:predicted unusual protein kinase regulating ubiquinone biosynthesis (AarF/ABC1/UbiB family)
VGNTRLRLNGHRIKLKPQVVKGDTAKRVRKAMADSVARQSQRIPASEVKIKVGDEWGGMGHSAHMHVPNDLLPDHADDENLPVVRSLPRRKQAKAPISQDYVQMQMKLPSVPKVGLLHTLRRLGVWLGALTKFQSATLWDRFHGRDSVGRRARRLRETFEAVGGTFVKIGQQMSSRLDLLPVQYCQELANMLDNYPPFPTAEAVEVIERTTGKKLDAIFSDFDPVPIGSASIACVYQAILRETGEKVAVKVRRPGIRELFEADFRVLDLLSGLIEGLTIVRPGYMENIRTEFRQSLTSELDFRREARLCELFERRARKDRRDYLGAPKIYFQYSNEEVLVQEFVSGMWLWEIFAALEHHDPAAQQRMRELNIVPLEVARRLMYANFWGIFSHLAFHADPHPANIVVQANNKVVFVDFGACGYFNSVRRTLYQRTYSGFLEEDPYGMAQSSMASVEPLPPTDLNAVSKDLENTIHNQMLAIKSKHSPWYERTSASLYIGSIQVTSKYNLPLPRDFLMFVRASLLYDTMCARLVPDFVYYREYKRFRDRMQKKAKKRGVHALQKRRRGLTGSDFLMLAQASKTWGDFMFRAQRLLNTPYDFAIVPYTIEKWTFTLMTVIQFLLRGALFTGVCAAVVAGFRLANQQALDFADILQTVVSHTGYLVVIALVFLLHIRLLMFRLGDKTRKE